ncbi:phage protein NinX family protein [Pseudomonas sp. NBRC 111144]|uniref:phage protein NinX family protein n=1 Tax=Pseudomonas sp. NBRC 111144 TaxID=1661059 RepID=UPI0006D453FF|nr:phage protein NinX family protein [Pseudomonas sp. NBRC 111144]
MTDLIEVRVSNLVGAALDWAVAQVEGVETSWRYGRELVKVHDRGGIKLVESIRSIYSPSIDWSQGGPLVDKHHGGLHYEAHLADANFRYSSGPGRTGFWCYGPTALIAFCRGLVKAKLGDTVQVPKELLQ